MSNRTDLGNDLEDLPSWVSEHLGERPMFDESNPLPSFEGDLPEASLPEDPSCLGGNPEVDAQTPLTIENTMTQEDLNRLKEMYSFPTGIQTRVPSQGETILSTRFGKIAFYETAHSPHYSDTYPTTSSEVSIAYSKVNDQIRGGSILRQGWGIPRAPRLWGILGKQRNKLPVLNELEKKRSEHILSKVKPGGYCDVSKKGWLQHRGNEGESRPLRDEHIEHDIPSRDDFVECIGVIKEDIGRIARRAFLDIPDLTLLRGLLSKRSDLGMTPMSLRPPRRAKWMILRARKPCPPKRTKSNKGASNVVRRPLVPGDLSTSLSDSLGPEVSMMSSAPVAQKILSGVTFLLTRKRLTSSAWINWLPSLSMPLVRQLCSFALALRSQDHQNDFHFQLARADLAELEMVQAQNRAFKAKNQLATLGEQAMKTKAELKDKSEAMAWLEDEVAELSNKLAHAKKLAIDEFKSSNDFKDTIIDSAATYFGEGFKFCKRQLAHHHPNLGIDLASIEMDTDLAEEEEVAKVGEKGEENEGDVSPTP
ncbi:hypothetical protein Acr_18g0008890 [Actinidia rufa]|uniref:Uncharacterized protein n=1 Tax=Actinidia rufa TaxID=165716 RepID=A0A7J0G7G9_9ERIC|nr:hypothetical protein Acr_18g0008890 [Actinidia rufa]